jgi:hypothetical protein
MPKKPLISMLDHETRLTGRLPKARRYYQTKMKKERSWYYLRIEYTDGVTLSPKEHRSQDYWKTFKLCKNLFFTNISIKRIEMVQQKPFISTEKINLLHER